jgi:hypothetical protein
MFDASAQSSEAPVARLVLMPAVITLAVTLLRLAGELLHGPRWLFSPAAGGGFALVGIAWLAPVFGIYFALRLARAGRAPKSATIAWQCAALGILFVLVVALGAGRIPIANPYLKAALLLWLPVAAGAALQLFAWPELGRTLLAYALTARAPVALLMLFALMGNWGTHYDAIPEGFPESGLLFKYVWLGFLPQMVFWVGFTILTGSLFGSIAHAWRTRAKRKSEEMLVP